MSPDYEINPQLKDKKAQVLSEMINDLVIKTPERSVPNIKAINQKTHGMCAAISIVRKTVAYEDKPNYVDSILSELSNNDTMEVYDIQNLGSGKKVPVKKTYIDFDYAQEIGYRIVDASTLQWMNIAGMYGAQNEGLNEFNAFDKDNFDAFHDSFFLKRVKDDDLVTEQSYYQSLVKAKDVIGSVKANKIKKNELSTKKNLNRNNMIDDIQRFNNFAKSEIKIIIPNAAKDEVNNIFSDLMQLQKPMSEDIKKNDKKLIPYSYIPNEETSQKEQKIINYFKDNYNNIDSEMLNKKVSSLLSITSKINELGSQLSSGKSMPARISQARKLYEAESTYRATKLFEFIVPDKQEQALLKYNVPDTETRIIQGFDKVIDRIEKKDDKVLLKHFAKEFNTTPDNKKEILDKLNVAKASIEIVTTTGFDKLYESLGYGSRHEFLLKDIQNAKSVISGGDKDELELIAKTLSVKPDKNIVLKEYDKIEKNLKENPSDEKLYRDTINKLGCKDQSGVFVETFREVGDLILSGKNDEDDIVGKFMSVNGLNSQSAENDIYTAINNIGSEYNLIADAVNSAINMLEVPNEDGTPYFTVSANKILQKKLENDGTLIPAKTMKKLQTRFGEIDKLRSSDEFSSRQGKISKPELYKLSKEESMAIKQISKKLNPMYSEVTRHLNEEYKNLKEPLEKLANYIGTNTGEYWIVKEGDSGLFSSQQVKIFEQLTDKPYYAMTDIEEAVNHIKNGEHSGVSNSSVFHDKLGGHSQYIVDIKNINNKDVLFHDNTWGASEHENTWIDSEGLTRTDYSDRRGGEKGYITDENWRNGNYVQNLTHKKGHVEKDLTENKVYKKIRPSGQSEHDFSLMSDIIVQGESPDYHDIAGSIKDILYIPDSRYVNSIEKRAGNMTKDEIKKAILRVKTAGSGYHNDFDKIIERITPTVFNKGITTQEEYDRLSDDDIVKVAFEKAAVRESYDNYEIVKKLAGLDNVKDVRLLKNKQKKSAMDGFKYSFSKTEEALMYPGLEHNAEIVNLLVNTLTKNGIKIKDEKYADILKNIVVFTPDERKKLDGSLKNTINLSVEKAARQFDENIPEEENIKTAKQEYLAGLHDILEKYTYFNKDDLKNNSANAIGIRHWVDRVFEPKTDEEFVECYKKVQDMTNEEFAAISNDVTIEELGMKDVKGFDILSKVNAANEDCTDLLRNTLFFDSYSKDMNMSKTKVYYKYDKLERKNSGSLYVGERTFDDLYRNMYLSLNGLNYGKMFAKRKDQFYKRYGVLPAYPKINLGDMDSLSAKVKETIDIINQVVSEIGSQKTCIYDIKLIDKLDNYKQKIPADRPMTKMERETIKTMVRNFIEANCQDPDLSEALESSYNIMDIQQGATLEDCKEDLDFIINTIRGLEKINSVETFSDAIKTTSKTMDGYVTTLINANIPPKYRRILYEDINKIINLSIHSNKLKTGEFSHADLVNLQKKIADASVSSDNKIQTDKFVRLMSHVNRAKILKNNNEINPEKLTSQIEKINDYSDKYVMRFIKPEQQEKIKTNINDWLSKELVGTKTPVDNQFEIEAVEQKLYDDFTKYHLVNNPIELLDEFLLLSASDSPDSKDKEFYKGYLEETLDLSKFIDLQDKMMEAVQVGNAAQVKNYFKEYNVTTDDGYSIGMDSDASIDYMLNSLILENNTKTAKMFVEKLGLGDRVMKIEKNKLKDFDTKNKIDEIASILSKSGTVASIVKEEFENINQIINNSANVSRDISKTKKNISDRTSELTKDPEIKKEVNKYLKAFDEGRKFISEHPDLPRNILLSQKLNDTFAEMNNKMNTAIQANQSYVKAVNQIYKFLLDIHLPEYSKGYKIQQELRQDFEDLAEYHNTTLTKATEGLSDIMLSSYIDAE